MSRWNVPTLILTFTLGIAGVFGGCSSDENTVAQNGPGTGGGSSGSGGSATEGGLGGASGTGGVPSSYEDFPKDPEVESTLPSDTPSHFSGAGDPTGGPCLFEPALGALIPKNWSPLRFEWTPGAGQNVFELRLHVDNQDNDLVVYTSQTSYTFAKTTWQALTQHSSGHDIDVTLRGAQIDNGNVVSGPATGAEGKLHIAPVSAPGSVVYWTSGAPGSGATALKGFTIGDTAVSTVLTPAIVGGDTTCVACHASAPDGKFTFYVRDGSAGTRSVDVRSVDGQGTAPADTVVSATALSLLGRTKQSAPVLSPAHYSATDAVAVAVFFDPTLTQNKNELVWTDLHTTDPNAGWGIFARSGDPGQVASPTFWHDGSTIAYVSAPVTSEGVIARVTDADPHMDIYTIPFANRQGGTATPLPGASDPAYWEYYPVISPEDTLLAFNRAAPYQDANGWADSYNEPGGEVFVVPSGGGTATRLSANDPPACTGKTSPGLTNSWPRWAPTAETFEGKTYYWVVFSSTRRDASNPQLFVSAVVTSESGGSVTVDETYPALYVTAQVPEENNHTPAWDFFQVVPQ
ncbi:MAG: hypothetical protein KC776_06535 [Myxococcales bacterium]|nr:hypothetical protein [Myxococcales bacterium]MCB9581595.1 hypothetical protein [Polyangiaceae bacterium]